MDTLFAGSTDITVSYNQTAPIFALNLGLVGFNNVTNVRFVDAQLLKETADNFTMRITMFNDADGGAVNLFMDFTLRTVPSIPSAANDRVFEVDRQLRPFCFNVPVQTQDTQTKYFVAELFTQ